MPKIKRSDLINSTKRVKDFFNQSRKDRFHTVEVSKPQFTVDELLNILEIAEQYERLLGHDGLIDALIVSQKGPFTPECFNGYIKVIYATDSLLCMLGNTPDLTEAMIFRWIDAYFRRHSFNILLHLFTSTLPKKHNIDTTHPTIASHILLQFVKYYRGNERHSEYMFSIVEALSVKEQLVWFKKLKESDHLSYVSQFVGMCPHSSSELLKAVLDEHLPNLKRWGPIKNHYALLIHENATSDMLVSMFEATNDDKYLALIPSIRETFIF